MARRVEGCGRGAAWLILLLLGFLPSLARPLSDQEAKLREVLGSLEAWSDMPEAEGFSAAPLREAHAVALIPSVVKVGLVVGGRYGKGVLCARHQGQWSDPLFVTLRGGRFGWQIDAQATDLVLMFMTPESLAALLDGQLTLGGGFAVAHGPAGRPPAKATDESLEAEVYVYASSRAWFDAAMLEGAVLQVVDQDNRVYYGRRDLGAWQILGGEVESVPASAKRLKARLAEMTK